MNRKPMVIKLIFMNHDGQESNIRHRNWLSFLFSVVMIKYSDKSKGERLILVLSTGSQSF